MTDEQRRHALGLLRSLRVDEKSDSKEIIVTLDEVDFKIVIDRKPVVVA